MQIGKAAAPVSHISEAYPDRVEVRGRDLTRELMGDLSFTEYFHLLAAGRTAQQAADEIRASGGKLPGFGHPVHKPLDPRAERILQLAGERGRRARRGNPRAGAQRSGRADPRRARPVGQLATQRVRVEAC